MAKGAMVSGAQLTDISRGDDPPYPPMSARSADQSRNGYAADADGASR